jgi:cytidine deaminase
MANSILTTDSGQWKILGELPPQPATDVFEEAMSAARAAKENAYAPYSNFHVGAAVSMDGILSAGCNVENASYGGTICAERSAIFSGVSQGRRKLEIIALTTSCEPGTPMEKRSPCGMCRQIISEFTVPNTLVLLDAGSSDEFKYLGEVIAFDSLLPLRFRLD